VFEDAVNGVQAALNANMHVGHPALVRVCTDLLFLLMTR
jgi:hypothetical protein